MQQAGVIYITSYLYNTPSYLYDSTVSTSDFKHNLNSIFTF